jgi:hypothetical protein
MVAFVGTFDAHLPLARTARTAAASVIRQVIGRRAEPGQRLEEEELVPQMAARATIARGGE